MTANTYGGGNPCRRATRPVICKGPYKSRPDNSRHSLTHSFSLTHSHSLAHSRHFLRLCMCVFGSLRPSLSLSCCSDRTRLLRATIHSAPSFSPSHHSHHSLPREALSPRQCSHPTLRRAIAFISHSFILATHCALHALLQPSLVMNRCLPPVL
jgi:hypothetical protein